MRHTRRRASEFVLLLVLLALLPAHPAAAQDATAIATIAGKITGFSATLEETHVAGNGDGLGLVEATFRVPLGIAFDGGGNLLVCDSASAGAAPPGIIRIVSPILGSSPTSTRGTLLYTVGPSPTLPLLGGAPSVVLPATAGITDLAVTTIGTAFTGLAGNWVIAGRGDDRIWIFTPAGAVVNVAGTGSAGTTDGLAATASFHTPSGVALDGAGNVYVADQTNHRIRKIDAAGIVTTVTGAASPPAAGAAECTPACAANQGGGFADGALADAQFRCPSGIVRGADDQEFFIGDTCNHRIRKLDLAAGTVSTIAGGVQGFADGAGAAARFNGPGHLDRDGAGNLYVADGANRKLRKVTPAGQVSTIGRNETATVDAFDVLNSEVLGVTTPPFADHFGPPPFGVAVGTLGAAGVSADDDLVFVSDPTRFRIREVARLP